MSVPKSKRKESQFEVIKHFYRLRKNITDLLLRDFGYSKKKAKQKLEKLFGGKPYEDLNEEEKEELLYWYSSNTDNIDKVYAVEKLFRKLNVNRKLSTLIREYTNKAHSYLDQIDVPEERKSYLRELSEVLIDRQG